MKNKSTGLCQDPKPEPRRATDFGPDPTDCNNAPRKNLPHNWKDQASGGTTNWQEKEKVLEERAFS